MYRIIFNIIYIMLFYDVVTPVAAQRSGDMDLHHYIDNNKKQEKIKNEKKGGIYFAITSNYTSLDNRDAFLLGFKAGKIYPSSFVTGFCAYYYLNGTRAMPALGNKNYYEYNGESMYGGIFCEYSFFIRNKISITPTGSTGCGRIAYISNYYDYTLNEWTLSSIGSDNFFYIESGAELEYLLFSYIKIALGSYYRFATKVKVQSYNTANQPIELLSPSAASSLSLGMTIKIGLFK